MRSNRYWPSRARRPSMASVKQEEPWITGFHVMPDGRFGLFGRALRGINAICAHYAANGESVAGIICPQGKVEDFEASITRDQRLFHVKVRITDDVVREYGREESLRD